MRKLKDEDISSSTTFPLAKPVLDVIPVESLSVSIYFPIRAEFGDPDLDVLDRTTFYTILDSNLVSIFHFPRLSTIPFPNKH